MMEFFSNLVGEEGPRMPGDPLNPLGSHLLNRPFEIPVAYRNCCIGNLPKLGIYTSLLCQVNLLQINSISQLPLSENFLYVDPQYPEAYTA